MHVDAYDRRTFLFKSSTKVATGIKTSIHTRASVHLKQKRFVVYLVNLNSSMHPPFSEPLYTGDDGLTRTDNASV